MAFLSPPAPHSGFSQQSWPLLTAPIEALWVKVTILCLLSPQGQNSYIPRIPQWREWESAFHGPQEPGDALSKGLWHLPLSLAEMGIRRGNVRLSIW